MRVASTFIASMDFQSRREKRSLFVSIERTPGYIYYHVNALIKKGQIQEVGETNVE